MAALYKYSTHPLLTWVLLHTSTQVLQTQLYLIHEKIALNGLLVSATELVGWLSCVVFGTSSKSPMSVFSALMLTPAIVGSSSLVLEQACWDKNHWLLFFQLYWIKESLYKYELHMWRTTASCPPLCGTLSKGTIPTSECMHGLYTAQILWHKN